MRILGFLDALNKTGEEIIYQVAKYTFEHSQEAGEIFDGVVSKYDKQIRLAKKAAIYTLVAIAVYEIVKEAREASKPPAGGRSRDYRPHNSLVSYRAPAYAMV